jgi:Domain of unknown function (DUF1841)
MSFFAHQDRDSLRAAWHTAWQRHCERLPLDPLQAQIADVIALHPEYHTFISRDAAAAAEFTPDGGQANPFLHMGLHLALREQLSTDRPTGIKSIYGRLATRATTPHDAEHQMIEVLATSLWEAQRAGRAPDEQHYLEQLRRL